MPAGIRKPMSERKWINNRLKFSMAQSEEWLKKRGYKYNAEKKWVKADTPKKYKKKTSMKAKTKTKAYYERKKKGIKSNLRDSDRVRYV
jgi:hypothetical protein